MNKFAVLFLFLILLSPVVFAEDDFFDKYTGIDRAWDNQKPITNDEFEKAIDTLTAKQKKKDEKARKKKIKKISGGGTSLHNNLEPNLEIPEQEVLKKKKEFEGQLINIPVNVVIDGNVLDKGYYNVFGEKDKDNNIILSLYQAHKLIGKFKAYETKDDYDSEELDFVKMVPYDDNYIKIIYGSLDFNAYGYLRYLPEVSPLQ